MPHLDIDKQRPRIRERIRSSRVRGTGRMADLDDPRNHFNRSSGRSTGLRLGHLCPSKPPSNPEFHAEATAALGAATYLIGEDGR